MLYKMFDELLQKNMARIFILLILLWLPGLVSIAQTTQDLIFVIRVDDILSRSTTILPRSIQPFEQIVESRGGKITWGVIPHRLIETPNLDGALAAEIRASVEAGHEVSLHGYTHICQLCNQSSHEMYCSTQRTPFSYNEQKELFSKGLEILEEHIGVKPVSFIPPGHISDQTTNQVLHDSGFRYLSTAIDRGFVTDSVYNLPVNGEYTWAITESNYLSNLTSALADIRTAAASTGVYALMLHDPFIRSGYQNGITLAWTGELLDSLNAEYGDRIQYKTLTEAGDFITERVSVALEKPVEAPTEFVLHQNYPNPFNATTQIPFTLNASSPVKIEVFSILGQSLGVLVEDVFSAGTHTVTFEAHGFSTGLYLYRITTPSATQTKVMNFLK